MTIQYCSDLHLEFTENKAFFKANPLVPVGDVLVLAGDIVPFAVLNDHQDFFSFVSDHFQQTYWIPGNHEYYGSDIQKRSGSFSEAIRKNVTLLNNTAVAYEDVDLCFSTLWSKISSENYWPIQQGLSDFQAIRCGNELFNPGHFNELHQSCLQFLSEQLHSERKRKTIVVTHHVPTFYQYPEEFKGDTFNEAFGVELYDLIEEVGPDYCIYGHHHRNVGDVSIANTSLLTNQMGYIRYDEHGAFNREALVTV